MYLNVGVCDGRILASICFRSQCCAGPCTRFEFGRFTENQSLLLIQRSATVGNMEFAGQCGNLS